jgi:hypothetical protein
MIVSGLLLLTPVKDTIWWKSEGGNVTQHNSDCSLWLFNQNGSILFSWPKGSETESVIVINPAWHYPMDRKLAITMQIGNNWLGDVTTEQSVPLNAIGNDNSLSFDLDATIDERLEIADHINIKTDDSEFSLALDRDKMGILITKLNQCRKMRRK